MKILSKKIYNKLIKKKLTIAVAESCTGGLLSSALTSVGGSSKIFNLGFVVYSNESKINVLKIPKNIIKEYGAVSKRVCFYMAKNLKKISKTDISVSITGIAGPSGGTKIKPVGLVYVGIKKGNKVEVKKHLFKNKGKCHFLLTSVTGVIRFGCSADYTFINRAVSNRKVVDRGKTIFRADPNDRTAAPPVHRCPQGGAEPHRRARHQRRAGAASDQHRQSADFDPRPGRARLLHGLERLVQHKKTHRSRLPVAGTLGPRQALGHRVADGQGPGRGHIHDRPAGLQL